MALQHKLPKHTRSDSFIPYNSSLPITYTPQQSHTIPSDSNFWREAWIKMIIPLVLQKTIHDSKKTHIQRRKIYLRTVSKAETQCNLQFRTLWLLPSSKAVLLNSSKFEIIKSQTKPAYMLTFFFFNLSWVSKTSLLRQREKEKGKKKKKSPLRFSAGHGSWICNCTDFPMSHTCSCICQTFPFWMPQEKLLFDNGMLEGDEETIQLCPAQ